jgi:pimeloyl-ACP methyl ester carboxylesterase
MRRVIVYVHGLWFGGFESLALRRRLARALGADCRLFQYSSVDSTCSQIAADLASYLRAIEADVLDIVGHSMGGVVLVEAFGATADLARELAPGRIVLTGAPVRGSFSGRRFAQLPFGRALLGRTGEQLLAGPPAERRWSGARDLGVIAGDRSFGLGRLLGPMGGPSDGTVLVAETSLPGATDRLCVRTTHTGLLFSAEVARQVAAFLENGRFKRPGTGGHAPAPGGS